MPSTLLSTTVWSTIRPEAPAHATSTPATSGKAPGLDAPTNALMVTYDLAGFDYITTATLLPAIARKVLPVDSLWPDLFQLMFGADVALKAFLSTRISLARGNRPLLVTTYGMQAVAVTISIVWPIAAGFMLPSALLGLPFMAITLFAIHRVRRLWPYAAPRLMGLMTTTYGIGQIVGPPSANRPFATTGGFSASLTAVAVSPVASVVIFLVVKCMAPAHT